MSGDASRKALREHVFKLEKLAMTLDRKSVLELVSAFRLYREYIEQHASESLDGRALSSVALSLDWELAE